MGYQVLARKYRPQRFSDVAGQDHVTRTLLNALNQNRIAHGYIFSGHRGIGKTTIARILAMALNCSVEVGTAERPTHEPCGVCANCREISAASRPDVSPFEESHSFNVEEIDAATNRGIDEARLLTSKVLGRPMLGKGKYRILILDEAHQITDAAWNALLKTLEDPPEWAIFMFATTQPEDIPQTIRSRCQHFSFHAVKFDDIIEQLKMIIAKERITVEDGALALLAEAGDGSMRDALSIMDQAIASAPLEAGKPMVSAAQVRELMGSVPNTVFEKWLEAVAAGQSTGLMEQVNVLLNAGHSPSALARQMSRYLRNTLMAKLGGEQTELLQISADERARAARTALLFGEEELTRNLQIVLRTFDDLNYRQEQRFHLELGLLKLIHAQRLLPIEELLSGAATGAGTRPAVASGAPRSGSTLSSQASVRPTQVNAVSSRTAIGFGAAVEMGQSAATPQAATSPTSPGFTSAPAVVDQPNSFAGFAPSVEQPAAPPTTTNGAGVDSIRQAVVAVLAASGHSSASLLLGTATWKLEGSTLRIEVPGVKKKMLELTVNAAAEKIIRQELQRLGAPARFMVTPGEGVAAKPVEAPVLAGSVQEAALSHPMVKRAQEIFKAEVRSVVDLRPK